MSRSSLLICAKPLAADAALAASLSADPPGSVTQRVSVASHAPSPVGRTVNSS